MNKGVYVNMFDTNIDTNKYRFFLAVAECKSFSKATEYLHVSQPAVSHAIKELEEQLNVTLFIRNNKTVSLTEDGEKLKYYIKNAFDTISLAEKVLKEKDEDLNGIIRIGIYSHISFFMLPKVISEFTKKYPKSKFSLYSSSTIEMLEKLRNNELDFVVMQYPIFINEHHFQEDILCELENCFFSDKEHYDSYIGNRDLIREFPLILPMRGYSDINRLEETFKSQNIILNNSIMCYTMELSKHLAINGVGIGWGLKKCIEKELANGNLYEIPLDFKQPKTTFSIAYDVNCLNKTTKEFIRFFKEKMKKIDVDEERV